MTPPSPPPSKHYHTLLPYLITFIPMQLGCWFGNCQKQHLWAGQSRSCSAATVAPKAEFRFSSIVRGIVAAITGFCCCFHCIFICRHKTFQDALEMADFAPKTYATMHAYTACWTRNVLQGGKLFVGVTTRLSSKEELHTLIPTAAREGLLVVGFSYKVLLQVQGKPTWQLSIWTGTAMPNC